MKSAKSLRSCGLSWSQMKRNQMRKAKAMTRGIPVIDRDRDLAGATPEKLARALLRNRNLRPGAGRKPVVRDEVAVEEVPADEPGDGIPHLGKRS